MTIPGSTLYYVIYICSSLTECGWETCICICTLLSLVRTMAFCKFNPWEQFSMAFKSIYNNFHTWQLIWNVVCKMINFPRPEPQICYLWSGQLVHWPPSPMAQNPTPNHQTTPTQHIHKSIFQCFYTPVFRRDVLWYGAVRPSVRPSIRPSVRSSVRPTVSTKKHRCKWRIFFKFCTQVCLGVPSINLLFVLSYLIKYVHNSIISDFSIFGIHRVIF